jgi:hypothetical protein
VVIAIGGIMKKLNTNSLLKSTKLVIGIAGLMVLSGCVQNHYKITTKYTDMQESIEITGEVEGKATIGKTALIFERMLRIVDLEYIKKK